MILSIDLELLKWYFYYTGYALLGIGLIFFIVYGILRNNFNYVLRSFVFFVVGGSLTFLFTLSMILDYILGTFADLSWFGYLVFILVSLLYTCVLGFYNLAKGKTRYQRLSFKKNKPSVNRDINQYVYVVYKCGNEIILEKDKDLVKGFCINMDKKHLFKDEIITGLNQKYNVRPLDEENSEVGVVTVNGKKPDIYYCYLIEIYEIPDELKEKAIVNNYEIINQAMNDLDKQIILRTLMREPFKLFI